MPEKPEPDLAALVREMATLESRHWKWLIRGLTCGVRRTIAEYWHGWAHDGQSPDGTDWKIWLLLAGRGFGKTRAGAEWISDLARKDGSLRLALVGATVEDVRRVMIEGQSGLLAVARRDENPKWLKSSGQVHFDSGAIAYCYAASNPEMLRGPEHHHAWCDELAKWENPDICWDNMMLGLRLGEGSRIFITTTPRPISLIHRVLAMKGTVLKRGSTALNRNLPEDFVALMNDLYAGTRLGRQELDGELLEDIEGALWGRALIESCRAATTPEMRRIVVAVDPPASADGDACGIIVAGLGVDERGYVLADCSVQGRSPEGWARAVADAAAFWQADRVVAEANQGGDMVVSTLRAADVSLPVKKVHASRGKVARAEPVAALYEAGKAFHAGCFPELEDELCGLAIGGDYQGPGRSPDRADALVWAMTELMLGRRGASPRVRQI